MKIAHVVDSMEVGGAEMLVAQMCRLQREQGNVPVIYALSALGALGAQMRQEGFAVDANVGRGLVGSSRSFYRLFRSSRPDVVHLHNPTPTIYAGPAARIAGVPSIVSTRHSLVAPPRNVVMERKYALAARFCDWVAGICDATTSNVKTARSAPLSKIVRIYNGALPIQPVAQEQLIRKDGFTLLYVGRLERVKNHPLLLRSLHAAVQTMPGLRLWMVGDGSERAALERHAAELKIQPQVRFWGQQLDVAPFFSSADAFIMSSVSEGLPISLLQAFSAGLPAIVTEVGGMAEVVHLSQAGITVPLNDVDAMAAAIVRLASGDAERQQFSNNGREAFLRHFTLERMVSSYSELYENTSRMRHRATR